MLYPIKPGRYIYADSKNYILCRSRLGSFADLTQQIEEIIEHFVIMNTSLKGYNAIFKIRGLMYDDKHGCANFYTDFLYDHKLDLKEIKEKIDAIKSIEELTLDYMHSSLQFKDREVLFGSDGFKVNHQDFYKHVIEEIGW